MTIRRVHIWFHITKRFTIISRTIGSDNKEKLEKVKWFVWHGNTKNALERLSQLLAIIVDEKLTAALQELYEYLERNQCYITDYQKRQNENLPFTSTIAESSVNELINTRQKNNKKMQWTRAGAHNVLQIRASRFSKSWEQDWKKAQEKIYLKAA